MYEEYEPSEELKTIIKPACDKAKVAMLSAGQFKAGQWGVGATDYENTRPLKLRLDWELDAETVKERGPVSDHVLELMYGMVATDMDDLLQNGDKDNPSDPLLRVADGSKKTGKKLVGLDIVEQHLVVVFVERKDVYEYTLYLNAVPEWE